MQRSSEPYRKQFLLHWRHRRPCEQIGEPKWENTVHGAIVRFRESSGRVETGIEEKTLWPQMGLGEVGPPLGRLTRWVPSASFLTSLSGLNVFAFGGEAVAGAWPKLRVA